MNMKARLIKLENRRTTEQDVTVLLPEWLAPDPVSYKSRHMGRKDIKPETPPYLEDDT